MLAATAKGLPTLAIDGVPLQHLVDPVGGGGALGAQRASSGSRRSRATRVVIVGLGLGYHVEALAARFAGAIVVVEPDLAVLALGARDAATSRRCSARVELVAGDAEPARSPRRRARRCVLAHAPALLRRRAARIAGRSQRWQASAARERPAAEDPGRVAALRRLVADRRLLRRARSPSSDTTTHLLDLAPFHDAFQRPRALRRAARAPPRARSRASATSLGGRRRRGGRGDRARPRAGAGAGAARRRPRSTRSGERGVAARALVRRGLSASSTYWRERRRAHYDYVFTIQTGRVPRRRSAQVTDARVAYLPCGFDPARAPSARARAPPSAPSYGSDGRVRRRRLPQPPPRASAASSTSTSASGAATGSGAGRPRRASCSAAARASTTEDVGAHLQRDRREPEPALVDLPRRRRPARRLREPAHVRARGRAARSSSSTGATLLPPLFAAGRELAIVGERRRDARRSRDHYLAHADERAAMAARGARSARSPSTRTATAWRRCSSRRRRATQERLRGAAARRRPSATSCAREATARSSGSSARFDPRRRSRSTRVAASLAEREGALARARGDLPLPAPVRRAVPAGAPRMSAAQRILIVNLTRFGDLLQTSPAIAALQRRASRRATITRRRRAELRRRVRRHPRRRPRLARSTSTGSGSLMLGGTARDAARRPTATSRTVIARAPRRALRPGAQLLELAHERRVCMGLIGVPDVRGWTMTPTACA